MPGTYNDQPKTIDEAIDFIMSKLTEEDKESIRETKREDLIRKHHKLGLYIANSLGLWRDNKKLLVSCGMYKISSMGIKDLKDEFPFTDPHDSSHIIMTAIWERLQEHDEESQSIVSM